jgi:hypothetical protein
LSNLNDSIAALNQAIAGMEALQLRGRKPLEKVRDKLVKVADRLSVRLLAVPYDEVMPPRLHEARPQTQSTDDHDSEKETGE